MLDLSPQTLTVVLADHHVPTRTGVRLTLEEDGWLVLGEAGTVTEAVAAVLHARPRLCVVNIALPVGGGVEVARRVKEALPDTAVVVLTSSQADEDLFAALRAGVDGYLLETMAPERLGATLRAVLDGEAALPRTLVRALFAAIRDGATDAAAGSRSPIEAALTQRELEVVELLLEGLSTARIARGLGLSPVTVRRHVSGVVTKLGVADREAALDLMRADRAARRSRAA